MNFGTSTDQATAFRILDRFVERGGTLVDTANCYASWAGTGDESELVIGAWLRSRGRDRITVATKGGGRPIGPKEPEGLAPSTIRAAAEDSLRRLDTDHIDLYYAHLPDDTVALAESLGAFQELVEAGKITAVGLSNYPTEAVRAARETAAANGWTPITYVQQRHSYLRPLPGVSFGRQLALTDDLADYARDQPDLTLLGYSPLLSGAYTRPDREFWPHYEMISNGLRLVALREVAAELGVSANQVVLAWMLAGNPAVHPVIGVSSVAQLDDCLAATELTLDDELLRRLDP
jgi:aryl-alcohol dehydrogenase-like predicted oxidoreductase